MMFQLTAARRRLVCGVDVSSTCHKFQLTAARRRLVDVEELLNHKLDVSTHSRPKAAGINHPISIKTCASFNSQPPEGGWLSAQNIHVFVIRFQLTAARRRLGVAMVAQLGQFLFQLTAARRRLVPPWLRSSRLWWFQLTAARRRLADTFCH